MPVSVPFNSTTTPTVLATISSGYDVTYQEILASIGTQVFFDVAYIYLYSTDLEQLNQNMSFNILDATGNRASKIIAENVDPYQLQNSLFFKPQDRLILDGRTFFGLQLNPLASVDIVFYGLEIDKGDMLSGESNFDAIIEVMKIGNEMYWQQW